MTVLVVAAKRDVALEDALAEQGMATLWREGIVEVLDTLRHREVAGVFVVGSSAGLDVLELVLNVRDVSARTPVVVADTEAHLRRYREALQKWWGVHFVSTAMPMRRMVDEVVRWVEAASAV